MQHVEFIQYNKGKAKCHNKPATYTRILCDNEHVHANHIQQKQHTTEMPNINNQ